jgi:hemerythrin-like domain-containing protein
MTLSTPDTHCVVLSRYIKQCQTSDDLPRSNDFICIALNYLCAYPQLFHHPVEERLINFLLSRDASILNIGDEVADEHRQLEGNTDTLRQQFSHELHIDNYEYFIKLKQQLLDVIDQHHNHLEHEEKYFLPLLERVMSRENWIEFSAEDNKKHPNSINDEKRGEFTSSLLYLAKRAKKS